jgi:L,D-transpeptidase ErfK/SrfK
MITRDGDKKLIFLLKMSILNRCVQLPAGLAAILFIAASPLAAETLRMSEGSDLVGEFKTATTRYEDTLLDVARSNSIGYHEIRRVNRNVDTWLPGEGQQVVLPKRYVLPAGARDGLVVNIPEMRLYYFPPARKDEPRVVMTYPLGVGREGWNTPYMTTRIIQKTEQPAWHPPDSIREMYAEEGKTLPRIVPPGPDNPLGEFAMRLGVPTYLIHGTNKPWGVGMRVSSGCIRLYPEDIEELFQHVQIGTPVHIVNQPYKVGLYDGIVYLETHPYLAEDADEFTEPFNIIMDLIFDRVGDDNYYIDWDLVREVLDDPRGIPVAVGMEMPGFLQARAENDVPAGESEQGLPLQLDTGLQTVPGIAN